ncbi:hypothetical protein MCOR25_010635 [Pyricularia grisea]|nr:hypothetical protein MCOR25_010635 [Pyricularia grisea]
MVAERAMLMQTAWGEEKGKMLAVHADIETVNKIIETVGGLEVACHNSPTGQVVVGTSQQIQKAETIIAESFKGTRYQHVDVTHGFHSKFVENILPGLRKVDESIEFKKPRIRLELCVDDAHEGQLLPGHIGRHAQAGTDAPIVSMTKRAVPDPGTHIFIPINFKASRRPETVMSDVTINLWRAGIDTTYSPWIGARNMKSVRLPVYQFTRKSFWTKFVDHSAELQGRLETALKQSSQASVLANPSKSKMVLLSEPRPDRFIINTDSSRFQEVVRGHAVCNQPMCPASMYMECVTMAVSIHESNADRAFPNPETALNFGKLAISHPLTLAPDVEVSLLLNPEPDNAQSWKFTIESTRRDRSKQPVVHVRGTVSIVPSVDMRHLRVLLDSRALELDAHPDAERIQSRRVYTLFGTLVDYSPVLRGIQTMKMQGKWAVGTIKRPKHLVSLDDTERSVLELADAVVADNFVQVLGLAINTSEHVSPGSAFIVSSFESFTLSSACRLLNRDGMWNVTSHYDVEENSKTIIGDIYVTDENGDVVASARGVRFSSVQLDNLGRVLGSTAASGQDKSPVRTAAEAAITEPYIESSPKMTATPKPKNVLVATPHVAKPKFQPQSPILGCAQRVRSIVARFTGATAGDMAPDLTLTELGIDSLAIVEFADEFHKMFQKHFATDDLSNMSLQTLINACSSCIVPESPSECATDSTSASGESFDNISNTEVVVGKA